VRVRDCLLETIPVPTQDDAKAAVSGIAREAGFEPINGGKLAVALYAEALGMFVVRLALVSGYGKIITFRAFNTVP
jgi:predicted dinucleotide-binding enzyme